MRTMYDSVNPAAIPTSAQLVAGYVDGAYEWSAADWARFPAAVKVTIAVFARHDAQVLDVESGDATPGQAPGWVSRQRAAGRDPTVYTSESNWGAVRAAFQQAGMVEPHWWIAAYPGSVGAGQLYQGSVAHQYADRGSFDLSAVADYWPGVDPPPPPEDEMTPEQEAKLNMVATLAMYVGFAQRIPDTPGFTYWVGKMATENPLAVIEEFEAALPKPAP